MRSLIIPLCLLWVGCSEPVCPSGFTKHGRVCKCPGGTQKVDNQCSPVDDDKGAGNEDEDDDSNAGDAASGTEDETEGGIQDGSAPSEAGGHMSTDANTTCFVDRDKDGVGAGMPVACDSASLIDSLGFSTSEQGNDCDDNNAQRSPRLSDLCGDNIDNDCDGKPDDEANNACGGPCTAQLAHQPGEACSNGLVGTCLRPGTYRCGNGAVHCDAPSVSAGSEICADQIDNDCDGSIDEIDAIDATIWYRDCDGDGYAPTVTGAVPSCSKPAMREGCTWTSKVPQPTSHSDWDCNDTSSAYRPGASYSLPPTGFTDFDLDCDGLRTSNPSFAPSPQACVSAVVDYLNRAEPRGIAPVTIDNPGCYVWRDGMGRYRNSPSTACPDESTLVSVDPWNDGYILSRPNPAIWPCK